MKINEKEKIIKDLNEKLLEAAFVVVSEYKGLDVASVTSLRKKIRETEAEFKVVKNTLIRIASKETNADLINDFFKGPNALTITKNDPVATAKVLIDFAKEFKQLNIKAGVLDGKVLDKESIKKLASVPPRDVLLSQMLSVFNAVPTSFVRVLAGTPINLLNVLNAIKEKKE